MHGVIRICHPVRFRSGSVPVLILKFAGPENDDENDDGGDNCGGNDDQDPYLRAQRLYQAIVKARTNDEFQAAINDAAPVDYDGNPQLAPAGAPSRLERLVIQPGESGGLLTNSEFVLAKFCTEEKLKKKTSDRLISMIKQRAFVIEDIHADSIREIEKMISQSSKLSKISDNQNLIYEKKSMAYKI